MAPARVAAFTLNITSVSSDFKVFTFKSKRDPNRAPYECRLYRDGRTTCNCPGWTKSTKNGVRTCKHTELVEGQTDVDSINDLRSLTATWTIPGRPSSAKLTTSKPKPSVGRKFDFDV